jgi:DNA-binding MarR family transcriptional regulator
MSVRVPSTRQIPPASRVAQQLSQVFFELLMRHKVQFAAEVNELDLSPIQARLLLCIDPDRPSTMSEVAQELGCGPSNITGLIDKLETRSLVERRTRKDDRRIKTVALTRKGLGLRGRLTTRLARPAPWMLGLTSKDQRQLVIILRRAVAAASQSATGAQPASLSHGTAGRMRGER